MLTFFLLGFGIFALVKGEIQATPTRKITADTARIIGIIFIVCAVLPFLLKGSEILMLLISLIAAVVGIVRAHKSCPVDASMEQKDEAQDKDKKKRRVLSIFITGVLLSILLILEFFGKGFGLSQEVITIVFFIILCLIIIVQVALR